MRLTRHQERGDTIIEVLFAVTIFAMIAVGSLAIMNQGTATAQRSLEVTLVRQQINAQAEALRYIHAAYVASYQQGMTATGAAGEWQTIRKDYSATGSVSPFGDVTGGTMCPTKVPGEAPFIMNARLAKVAPTGTVSMTPTGGASVPPFAQVMYNDDSSIAQSYGLWIEAKPDMAANGTAYVDFHIRACWDTPGSSHPSTLGTIVRLYEPAGK